ncbi:protein kinase 1 [Urbanus proteus nucleopolyhedrovirus]|uniref:non-specific serine/threonine protein kinase n=1 Tax=Urbanus proteus nucleopolyhedrovirus TaxID=1675866 RepID=A0A161C6U5_9ABAC|nr:protein kinase 1 [Urbanus proteus nucleopolyhedrovirus]AKR17275.1 protein kinase 1 [Urbanus proteus nucleopolyhedrovirus]
MDTFIEEINDFYLDINKQSFINISSGQFSKLSVWLHKPTHKKFLIKEMVKNYNGIETFVHHLMKDNKYFIKLYYSFTSLRSNFLIMDYIENGDLFCLLQKEGQLSELETKFIVSQCADALNALHEKNIIHNDIKLENVLYKRHKQVYICDYGLCKINNSNYDGYTDGTIDYFSPEKISLNCAHDVSVDWWALGVLTHELFTGVHPYKLDPNEAITLDQLCVRQRKPLRNKHNLSFVAFNFIEELLKFNKNYRLTSYSLIKKHKFLL